MSLEKYSENIGALKYFNNTSIFFIIYFSRFLENSNTAIVLLCYFFFLDKNTRKKEVKDIKKIKSVRL
jgi:hypothetical protein